MSQHRSLRVSSGSKVHRSVFKRFERIRMLEKQGRWKEEASSVFGLPKVKSIKIKVKKEKAAETTEAAQAEVQAAAGAPAASVKPQAAAVTKKTAEEPKGKEGKAAPRK